MSDVFCDVLIIITRDSGNSFPSSKSRKSRGKLLFLRFGVPHVLSNPSSTNNSFEPNAVNEFQAVVKPPKPVENGLFGPLVISSYFGKAKKKHGN